MKDFLYEQDKTVQILPETERLSPKNLLNFTAKFFKGLNTSWLKFNPFCIDKSEQNEAKG